VCVSMSVSKNLENLVIVGSELTNTIVHVHAGHLIDMLVDCPGCVLGICKRSYRGGHCYCQLAGWTTQRLESAVHRS
jgi:hypothetical protein